MNNETNKIRCPNCGKDIDVNEILYHQLDEEIKKGERGADCLQTVHTHHRRNCGTIYYESKRTKSFQPAWIEKFKTDIRDKNADIGVLVTEAMPADMERIGLRDGVWVCSFNEFKGLCADGNGGVFSYLRIYECVSQKLLHWKSFSQFKKMLGNSVKNYVGLSITKFITGNIIGCIFACEV